MNHLLSKYKSLSVQARASFWFLICSFLQKGIQVFVTPVLTRLLSAAEYGQYSVFHSWFGILSLLITLNLFAGVYDQGLIKFNRERNILSSSLQGLTLILSLGWFVLYALAHDYWNKLLGLNTVQMLSMLLMIWATAAFSFWSTEQRVTYSYQKLVILTLLISLAKPVVGILFISLADDKVTAYILGLVLVELIGFSGCFIAQMRRGKKFFSSKFWKYALAFNIPLVPHYLSQTILNSADRIMIERMVDAESAGIYSLAYSLSQIMTLFNAALMQTMSPWIYQKIKDKKTQDIARIAYPALILIAGVNILLIAFAPEAVAIFAPENYYNAIWIIPTVSMSVPFMFSYDLFAKFEFYYEKTTFIMLASVLGALMNIILNAVFIPLFGYYAAGYTTLVCYMVYALGHYIFMNRTCVKQLNGIRPYSGKKLMLIYSSFLLVGFLFLVSYQYSWLRWTLICVILIFIFRYRKVIIRLIEQLLHNKREAIP